MDCNHKILAKRASLDDQLVSTTSLVMGPQTSLHFSPIITIAIPTYRRPELLIQAIRSAINQQTTRQYQIIVVDNDDSDEFRDKVNDCVSQMNSPLISLYRNRSNIGMFGNWNCCLILSQAPWVSILNDDDILSSNYVECVCDIAEYRNDASLIQVGYRIFDMRKTSTLPLLSQWSIDGEQGISSAKSISFSSLCLGNNRTGSLGIAYRRDIAMEIGGFNSKEYPTADYCFHARMLANGYIGYDITAPLSIYRIFENESLKPAVLSGFIANDFRLRTEASKWLNFSLGMRLYARYTAIANTYSLEKIWGISIKGPVLNERVGFIIERSNLGVFTARLISLILRNLLTQLWKRFGSV